MSNIVEFKRHPHKDYPYFLYDPGNQQMMYFKSEEDRQTEIDERIQWYLEETWGEEVEEICIGVVTHIAQQVGCKERPDDLDEEGCDGEGQYWPDDVDYICDYQMLPVDNPSK